MSKPEKTEVILADARRSFRELSIETRLLSEKLVSLHEKEGRNRVSFSELREVIGRDVNPGGPGYHSLLSARRRVFRLHGLLWDSDRKTSDYEGGLKLLTDTQKVSSTDKEITDVRKKAKRGMSILASVEFGALTEDDKRRHNVNMTLLGLAEVSLRPKQHKAIERKVADHRGALPFAKALTALSEE